MAAPTLKLGSLLMLVLVIDASSAAVTVGVVDVPADAPADPMAALPRLTVRAQRTVIDARAHAELLSTFARESVDEAGATMRDLGAVVAGIGPGPYTGLRVGIVTAAAFADALGIAVYGVCSLDGIGLAARDRPAVLVASDARRKEVYWARYVDGRRDGDPQVHRPADLAALLGAGEVQADAMTGAGARMYADALGLPMLDVDYPGVAALAAAAVPSLVSGAPTEILAPMYLRQPDAEVPSGPAKSTLGL
ncbi:MAG: Peptidase glycoprotease [Pseudonocardiales bacterium]|nr:Peptidase glycoprotease [Pseudonocardiales bacterium]